MKSKLFVAIGAVAALSSLSANLYAGGTTGAATVQFEIAGQCTLDTTAAGTTYASFNAPFSAGADTPATNATVTVNCTSGVPYKIGANGGSNFGADQRYLSDGGANTIPYTIKNGATEWGDADISAYDITYFNDFAGINAEDRTGTGAAENITITYEVSRAGGEPTGQYSDTVTFVVAWP
ncbi:MAG: fimbrial major subunit CsuA/B family protein [Planctomycetes bacterium]|nr:fimbrial major subunit CsuA/B family protein [Planctomycetota bacterium]